MLKRRSLFERCGTLPVGTWSVVCKQSFRCVGGQVHNLTTSSFRRKEAKFVGKKTAIYRRNRSSVCLLFVKLALLCVFFFVYPTSSHTQKHAGRVPSTQAVAPSPSHNRDGSEKVWTFDKRAHRHKPFDRQRFVSILWLRHAQLRDLVEVWALTGECSPPIRECSPPVRECSPPVRECSPPLRECSPPDWDRSIFFRSNLCRFRSRFVWALPLSLS